MDLRFKADFKGLLRNFRVARRRLIFAYLAERVWFPLRNDVGAALYLTFSEGSPVASLGNRTPRFGLTGLPAFPRKAGGTYLPDILLLSASFSLFARL